MLDKHTARALVALKRLSSEEYLRLFGEDIRKQMNDVRAQHRQALKDKQIARSQNGKFAGHRKSAG